jgi:hypothetical protein
VSRRHEAAYTTQKPLTREFERERDDHGLRCWLLELIGEAQSPAALPVLAAQLNSTDEALRGRAVRG